jgi:6-phosphofructokinase 1
MNIRIGVATSGGDAPGMNACVRAIVKASAHKKIGIYGIKDGILGLLRGDADDIKKLSADDVRNIINLSGTILGTSRMVQIKTFLNKIADGQDKAELTHELIKYGLSLIRKNINKHKLSGLILIGGDDTCKAAHLINQVYHNQFPICVIPATIDNDIKGTDVTIGFDSAVSAALHAIDLLRATASSHKRLFIVEVMGRSHGYIGLDVGIAGGAEEILIPEINHTKRALKEMARRLINAFHRGRRSALIIISEGVKLDSATDKIGSAAYSLSQFLHSVIKDWEIRVSVIGHIQRGAVPTFFTRDLASEMGSLALDKIYNITVSGCKKDSCAPLLVGKKGNKYVFQTIPNPPTKSHDRKLVEKHKRLSFLSY